MYANLFIIKWIFWRKCAGQDSELSQIQTLMSVQNKSTDVLTISGCVRWWRWRRPEHQPLKQCRRLADRREPQRDTKEGQRRHRQRHVGLWTIIETELSLIQTPERQKKDAYLSLPVCGVDQDNGVRYLIIREQDVVQLIQNRLSSYLKTSTSL